MLSTTSYNFEISKKSDFWCRYALFSGLRRNWYVSYVGNGRFAMGGLSVNMMKQRSYVVVANLTLISEMTSTSPKNEGFPTKIPKNGNVPIFLVLLVVFSAIC